MTRLGDVGPHVFYAEILNTCMRGIECSLLPGFNEYRPETIEYFGLAVSIKLSYLKFVVAYLTLCKRSSLFYNEKVKDSGKQLGTVN